MGYTEKFLGLVAVPFLLVLLILHATGLFTRLIHIVNTKVTAATFMINNLQINVCFVITFLNLAAIVSNYLSLSSMSEPSNAEAKLKYFEDLYRMYRNLLLNVTCALLIFELWFNSRNY